MRVGALIPKNSSPVAFHLLFLDRYGLKPITSAFTFEIGLPMGPAKADISMHFDELVNLVGNLTCFELRPSGRRWLWLEV